MTDFATTRWSLIAAARSSDPIDASEAMAQMCTSYRPAVLAFAKRLGVRDPEDLTQAFFVRFLEQRLDQHADPQRGRFRHLMKSALKHFAVNELEKNSALKRTPVELGSDTFAASVQTPEQAFNKAWVNVIAGRGLLRLREEARAAENAPLLNALLPFVLEAPENHDLQVLAERFAMRANTLAVSLSRMRARFRVLVRDELAQTVCSAEDLQAEQRELKLVLSA